ncbi:4672_t:CDS:2, partial [Racocetra persica]
RYLLMAKDSREESRKILLKHLRTYQKVYRPELLVKFSEMVDEFKSIINAAKEAIIDVDLHLNDRNTLGNAALLCGKALVIAGIWVPLALIPGAILSGGGWLGATCSDSTAIIKENVACQLLEKFFVNDEENCKTIENLRIKLKETIEKFQDIYFRFDDSEYKKQYIDRKKIEVINDVLIKLWGEKIKDDISLESDERIKHSTCQKAIRAVVEAVFKVIPSPLPIYCIYRDRCEIESRTSLKDMEKAINNWREELEGLKEKDQQLNREREK